MLDSKKNHFEKMGFYIVLGAVFLISIFVLFVIRTLLKQRLDIPFNMKASEEINHANFFSNKRNIDTLILGDSHPGQSLVNPLPINWFKATHAGEDIESSLLKFEYFTNNSRNIKYLILPIDYHSLNGSWGVPKQEYDIYRRSFSTKILGLNKLFDDYNRKLVVNWFFSKLNNRLFGKISSQDKPATGREEIVEGDPDLIKRVEIRAKGMLHHPIIDSRSVSAINRIFVIAKEKGIKVIGVRYPLPNDYIKYTNNNGLNRMDEWLAQNKNNFYRIMDYRDVFKKNQEYFGNEDHVNIRGSNKFTSIFVSDYFKSVYKFNDEGLKKLPTNYPFVGNSLVTIKPKGIRLVNIESPYGIESDGQKSWYWIGEGEKEGLTIRLYSKESMLLTIMIEYDNPYSIQPKIIGREIQILDNSSNHMRSSIYIDSGINDFSLQSGLYENITSKTTDFRNLVFKIRSITIED